VKANSLSVFDVEVIESEDSTGLRHVLLKRSYETVRGVRNAR
jgi:hypothetical protein